MSPETELVFESIKIGGIFVTTIGAFLAYRQFRLANRQFQAVVTWNKLNATFALFNNQSFLDRERPAAIALKACGFDLYQHNEPLSDKIIDSLFEEATYFAPVKEFLNYLEDYSTAVTSGILDDLTAFNLMGDVISRHHRIFRPLIIRRRKAMTRLGLWIELQKLSVVWDQRLDKTERLLLEAEIKAEEKEREAQKDAEVIRNRALEEVGAKEVYSSK